MQAQYMLTRFSHWQLLSKPTVLLFQCYVIIQVTSQACAMTVDTAVHQHMRLPYFCQPGDKFRGKFQH